jgi:peroxiredoxin
MLKVQKSEMTKQLIKNAASTFPEIALPNAKGDTIKLSKFIGKVILLNFWSYESKACLMANRDFMHLYKKYSKSGLIIYQLSVDSEKSKWLEAVKDIPWISVAEISSTKSYYAGVFNITGIPTSFIIDQKGTILAKAQNLTELDRTISRLLKK